MIIGLTGPNASGKGEAALYIRSKGFSYRSLSDILREEAARLGIKPVRGELIKLGNKLRREKGASYLAQQAIEEFKNGKDYVVDSIRNPSEIEELRKIQGFILIGIDASLEARFERGVRRKRPGDAETLKDFIEKEEKENKNNPDNQQLEKCLELADVTIVNDSTIKRLREK